MATVQLADIFNAEVFTGIAQEAQIRKNAFISSGVAQVDSEMQEKISVGGNIGVLTNYAPLGEDEPNYSNDATGDSITPLNIASQEQFYRLAIQNQSWSVMKFAQELALSNQDPATAIASRIGAYWANQDQSRLIQSSMGVLADNIANDSSDMLYSVATDAVAAITDAERISGTAVLQAAQTMGDAKSSLTMIAMHSEVLTTLKDQNLITFIPAARGETSFSYYQGYLVVEDDSLPAVAGTNRITYTCVLFGAGLFSVASGNVAMPMEIYRLPLTGKGGGQDILISRRSDLLHPRGFSFLSASIAGGANSSATQGELALAANWNRVYDRKNLPLAFLQVNN